MDSQSSQLALAQRPPDRPIRLLLDGRKLGDGGIGVYIENVVLGLVPRSDIELTVLSSEAKAVVVPWRDSVSWLFDSAKPYSLSEYFLLARRIDWKRFDLYHAPHFTLPFGIPVPTVVTIHDLIHVEYPESFYYPYVARFLISSAVRRASAVIAVSQATKKAVRSLTGARDDQITVVPNAISPSSGGARGMVSMHDRVRDCIGQGPYFIAVVSNLKPHKGLHDLLRAYQEAVASSSQNSGLSPLPRLVLAGYGVENISREHELHSLVTSVEGVTLLGAVTPEELYTLYRAAHAVVVPSLAEGFCLPALEAQSVGTRVVCRPIPALQELVTRNDCVAHDCSWQALSTALVRAAQESASTYDCDAAHLERFSLERVSEQLYSVYSKVAQRGVPEAYSQRGIA